MTSKKQAEKRGKPHQKYYTSDGELCPGVTTVLGVMNKPQLVNWANRLGLEGVEVSAFVDKLARIGTLIHYMVECDIKGIEPELMDYTPREVETAKVSFQKWVAWKSTRKFVLIESELQLCSDAYRYGGTCDIYAEVDGKKTVLDIKTSKACYGEQKTQVVAYKQLLVESERPVDECRIVRIGRDDNEGFDDILIGAVDLHWKRFEACLNLYRANKILDNSN